MRSDRSSSIRPRRQARRALFVARCSRAFTMIELVVVVLIMSILAAVTAPSFMESLLFHRVETAARRVKADIEYTRQRARLTSTAQTITFTAAGAYTISGAKSLENSTKAYSVNLLKSPYLLDSATVNFANTLILSFDGYGTPASGGTVVLNAKSHKCTVTVDAITGDATITSSHAGGATAQVAGG
jgi:prepilin-type N-terminal cleavage/methylation domain-containing protein